MILSYKNIPIYYEDEGHGHAIVLLHGFLENSKMWNDLKPMILKTNRVVCVDLLGHGQTGCLGYIHTMNDMAEGVLAVLNYLNIGGYTIIGHSMGGYVALALAENSPTEVKGLCLMNSTFEADDEELSELRKKANKLVQSNFEQVVRQSFINLFSPESRVLYKKEMNDALKEALSTSIQGYIAAQEGMRIRADKFKLLNDLDAKKLIVIGAKDTIVNKERILKQTDDTNIQCEVISGGHMSHIENKEELSYIISRFIELKYF